MTARGRTQFAPTIFPSPWIESVGRTFAYGKVRRDFATKSQNSRNVPDRPRANTVRPYRFSLRLDRSLRGRRLRRPAHLPTKIEWEFAGATMGRPFFADGLKISRHPPLFCEPNFITHYSFLIAHFLNLLILCRKFSPNTISCGHKKY